MSNLIKSIFRRLLPKRFRIALYVFRNPDSHVSRDSDYVAILKRPISYNQDGLVTSHNCDFMTDKRFNRAYLKGKETGSWKKANIEWRVHVLCFAAKLGARLEGDFVECGVNRGGFSRAVIDYVSFNELNKTFFLLDTFCGLDDQCISDAERKRGIAAGGYEECYEAVKQTFEPFQTCIIKGTIPATLEKVETSKVAYLSIDMNCAAPEIAAAEFFWDKLVPGAPVVLDDYGWTTFIEQKLAFDEFASRKGIEILSLPTGQGLFFKPYC